MKNSLYTFAYAVNVDEKKISDFLVASSGSINDIEQPIVKKKIKHKVKNGKLHLKIEAEFLDGTIMTFKHVSDFDVQVKLVEVSEDELMQQLTLQNDSFTIGADEEKEETTKAIGFTVDFDDDDNNENNENNEGGEEESQEE